MTPEQIERLKCCQKNWRKYYNKSCDSPGYIEKQSNYIQAIIDAIAILSGTTIEISGDRTRLFINGELISEVKE